MAQELSARARRVPAVLAARGFRDAGGGVRRDDAHRR